MFFRLYFWLLAHCGIGVLYVKLSYPDIVTFPHPDYLSLLRVAAPRLQLA